MSKRRSWLWAGAAVVILSGGCGVNMTANQQSGEASPTPPAAQSWYSVADGVPRVAGAVLVTTGPLASQNGFDNAGQFQRVWSYTGSILSASVDIDRGDPAATKLDTLKRGESVARTAGHIVAPLPGAGDGALAIAPKNQNDKTHSAVRAQASSGNAIVSVLMRVDGQITNEADLTAHAPELVAALNEVLDDLRVR